MKLTYQVNDKEKFDNIKEVLKVKFKVSDRLLLKLKNNKKIFLNLKVESINCAVKPLDIIEVYIDFEEDNSNIVPTKMDLNIIYEDEAYLVIDKCAGIPVHPSMEHYDDSLSNGLRYYFDCMGLRKKIRPVNRIDKDTSGIVIFAKNEYIQECLIKQMKTNTFTKEYIAICDGIFDNKSGTIDAPVARKENSIIERCVSVNGENAVTHYEVIKEISNVEEPYSIVRCRLETGRTHQIRVHMKHINHPLLGDTLYGSSSKLINRQALHSYRTCFTHPINQELVTYIAPIPQDMKEIGF